MVVDCYLKEIDTPDWYFFQKLTVFNRLLMATSLIVHIRNRICTKQNVHTQMHFVAQNSDMLLL